MRKKISASAVFFAVLFAASFIPAEEAAYHYEPEKVTLSGTLIEKMFYGPPGYGEDPEHDAKEQAYIIQLERPISVLPAEGDAMNERHDNVSEVQVINMTRIPLESMLKKKVMAKGTLFSAETGHHHTDVLISAEQISPSGESSPPTVDSPENVVRSLYHDFPPDGEEAIHLQKKEVLAKYFADNLVDLFLKDQECAEKEKGICNIDFMILYAAQDYEITDLQIGAFDPVKKVVSVQFKNFGKPTILVYLLWKTPAGWRIADIRYQKGLTLLETLRQ